MQSKNNTHCRIYREKVAEFFLILLLIELGCLSKKNELIQKEKKKERTRNRIFFSEKVKDSMNKREFRGWFEIFGKKGIWSSLKATYWLSSIGINTMLWEYSKEGKLITSKSQNHVAMDFSIAESKTHVYMTTSLLWRSNSQECLKVHSRII